MKKILSRFRRLKKTRMHIQSLNINRLVILKTCKHIYAQIISFKENNIIITASTLEKKYFKNIFGGNINAAKIIGKLIAQRSLKKGIKSIALDKSGYKYHGRIKALANSSRKYGLIF
jgi:large subunit ribosomal protein L18